jgi:hypothetical protein
MADYYVSAAGNDSNAGTYASPWRTITKVNTMTGSSGALGLNNRVLFRRGDTFYGRLRPSTSLDANAQGWLKFGAYGDSSTLPIISGYKILNTSGGWQVHDSTTWKIDLSNASNYTGNSDSFSYANNGFIKVDGVIKGSKKSALVDLANQWDFYASGTTLYVRSSANPTSLASDIRCSMWMTGAILGTATELADLTLEGWGGHGVVLAGSGTGTGRANRGGKLLRSTIREIGGTYLYSTAVPDSTTTRYGNAVNVAGSDIYCEYNTISDVYDTAYTIQGGTAGGTLAFNNITWRRNLTYRCAQAEEYWYIGTGPGFVNCLSEYNTNLFSGYGWGADVRPDTEVRSAQLTYLWGDTGAYTADLTIRRNIYYDVRGAFAYHAYSPVGLASDRNVIMLRPGTKMRYQTSQTIEAAADWAASQAREQNSSITILPTSSDIDISNADVTAALATLNNRARVGQIMSIQAPWT